MPDCRSRLFRAVPACVLALAVGAGCAGGPRNASGDAARAASLAARLDALRQQSRIPGLAVAVVRDDAVVYAGGFGLADVERGVPVTPDTPFNIASVSKTISAVVALRLVEQGKLDLDLPMSGYRGFAQFCAEVLGEGGIFFRDYACRDARLTLRHVLSMTANGEPGARFWYNPVSYSWAARPMAQAAERDFSSLVTEMVLEPAGMAHSARIHRGLPLRADLAAGLARPYHLDDAGRIVPSDPPPPQGDGAAGGVIASANDLARFDIALDGGRLLAPASVAAMWTPARDPAGRALPYALGWYVEEVDGRRVMWHAGLWEGRYSALYLKIPAERLALVLLANSDGLRWEHRLDEGALARSPFAQAFLAVFGRR